MGMKIEGKHTDEVNKINGAKSDNANVKGFFNVLLRREGFTSIFSFYLCILNTLKSVNFHQL